MANFGETIEKLIEAVADTLPDTPLNRLDVSIEMSMVSDRDKGPYYGMIICGPSRNSSVADRKWLLNIIGHPSYVQPGKGLVWRFQAPC